MFDSYYGGAGDLQLKVGDPSLRSYQVGQEVDSPDGIYVASGYEGFVVIQNGKLIGTYRLLYDTMGTRLAETEDIARSIEEKKVLKEFRAQELKRWQAQWVVKDQKIDPSLNMEGQSQE